MKVLLTICALLNGGYMLADGINVLMCGKYIGPEKPGPWSGLFYKLNIDVFRLAPLFIIFGVLWLVWLYALWAHASSAYLLGVIISVLTLWYLPLGTIISVIVLLTLLTRRGRLGI